MLAPTKLDHPRSNLDGIKALLEVKLHAADIAQAREIDCSDYQDYLHIFKMTVEHLESAAFAARLSTKLRWKVRHAERVVNQMCLASIYRIMFNSGKRETASPAKEVGLVSWASPLAHSKCAQGP